MTPETNSGKMLLKSCSKKKAIREEKVACKAGGSGDTTKVPSKTKISSWKKEMKALLPTCFE